MARTGAGLSDNQRTVFGIVIVGLLTLATSVAVLPETVIPKTAVIWIGIAATLITAIDRYLGIRDATTSAVAKEVKADFPQFREPTA